MLIYVHFEHKSLRVKKTNLMASSLIAGAATVDITPVGSPFLFGYPHVERYATGVHDPLLSSALFLTDGRTPLLLVANDVIFISRETARRVRDRIESKISVPASQMIITATHTHSGPTTVDMLSNESDRFVPPTDPAYVQRLEDGIVEAALQAYQNARPAKLGLALADGSCVGTNRHDPTGPSDPEVPVLVVRDSADQKNIAVMLICSMHPTVLHEDSTLLSGDFPAMTRQYLQEQHFGEDCPILYHTGPCGNLSPRHVTRANTLEEAKRLGNLLGQSITSALDKIEFTDEVQLGCSRETMELPRRAFPSEQEAQKQLENSEKQLETLRREGTSHACLRTAECDQFGAEETLTLARAATAGRLDQAIAVIMPVEIMVMRIGPWSFVAWPGEVFVEFALQVKSQFQNCHLISLANGELQGYLVTEEAVHRKTYEALNSLLASPAAGNLLVEKTLKLLDPHTQSRQE